MGFVGIVWMMRIGQWIVRLWLSGNWRIVLRLKGHSMDGNQYQAMSNVWKTHWEEPRVHAHDMHEIL